METHNNKRKLNIMKISTFSKKEYKKRIQLKNDHFITSIHSLHVPTISIIQRDSDVTKTQRFEQIINVIVT